MLPHCYAGDKWPCNFNAFLSCMKLWNEAMVRSQMRATDYGMLKGPSEHAITCKMQ